MRKTKSKSPGRPKKSASLPVLKKTYVAPLQLCSVNIAKHSFSFRDVRKGMVEKPSKRRLPFMSAERGIEWELAAATKLPPPKLPSLRKVMSSIHSMNLSMEMSQTISKGSLRSNPAFGGSGPLEEGPKLPMKHSTRRMQGLMQQKTPKLARSNPPAKRGKKQNWAGAETELVEYNEPEESHLEESPGIPDSDSSLSSSSGSSSDSDWGDDSSEEDKPPPTYLTRGRSSGMTRRMSAFAMMLPLLDSNNEPKRRGSVAEVFLKTLEDDEDKKDDELDFPWSDEECRSVFIKFDTDTDGEVATEELELMLKYMGCILRPGEVERLIHDMFSYATVSWEEWNTFLERYREVDERYLRAEFAAADSDKNGVLDVDELHTLLAKMGYVTDAHTVMEAMETIGCKQTVNLRKFEKLREHLRCTEGLAKDDVTQLRELYDRVAATAKMQQRARKVDLGVGSHSDIAKRLIAEQQEMPVEDVQRVITFLGYSVSTDRVDQITREVDNDLSRFISFQELLKLIRRVRDVERESIAAMFEALAGDGDLPLQDLPRGLTELRYYPTDDMVFHVLDELGPRSKTHINQGEVFAFLCLFREKEGLTPEERREMRQVFEHQCKITAQRAYVQQLEDPTGNTKMTNNGSPKLQPAASPRPTNPRGSTLVGPSPKAATTPSPRNLLAAIDTLVVEQELDALRMNRVMRWFGFEKPLMQVQDMMASIDLDAKGKLSFEEFLKLMNQLFSEAREEQWKLFTMLDNKGNGNVMISKLPFAVSKLARTGAKSEKAANMSGFTLMDTKSAVSRSAFELFFRNLRKLEVEEMRANACYSLSEVMSLRDCFNKFDKDRSGTVENRELAKIIAEYFPEATKSREGRAEVQLILKDVDSDGSYRLAFTDFLVLMRRCDDIRDESDVLLEARAVEKLSLDPEEVEGFRTIFAAHASLVGELNMDTLVTILSRISDFSDDDVHAASAIVREIHPEHKVLMRFPHFLQVMRRLTDENVGNINHHCSRVLKKAATRASLLKT